MRTQIQSSPLPTDPPTLKLDKPKKVCVPIAVGLAWRNDPDFIYEEKLDGRFETRQVHGTIEDIGDTLLAGEYVRGEFYAFDLLRLSGTDFRNFPLYDRLAFMDGVFATQPKDCTGGEIHRVPAILNFQPSTLQDIWNRGGEGIVRKRLDSKWGEPMEACKRLETFYCLVTGLHAGQSVQIALVGHPCRDAQNSAVRSMLPTPSETVDLGHWTLDSATPCGNVKLGGGKCDKVRIGSILKIEGFGLTREGKIREPRPCRDTATSWLIKY